MLKELPETLDETYERILRDINKANRDHARRLLQCLTVAVRPLRVAELAEVLAIDFGTTSRGETSKLNTDWRWEDQEEAVLSTCSSLISVVDEKGSQIVQFSHFSVKEFLTSSRIAGSSADISPFHILLESAHTILAKACLVVLLRLGEVVDEDNVRDKFPLARYAGEHWVDHARFENVSSHIREEMEDLFDPDKPYFAVWLQVHDIDTEPLHGSPLYDFAPYPPQRSNSATPLYYAALCGFHDLAEQLIINHPQQVYITGGYFMSPLGAALRGGHAKIAQVLYERGADVDVQGHDDCTLLYGASSSEHFEIVQWLLSHGANPNDLSKLDGWTSLHAAAFTGHVEVIRLLLQYKADIYAHDPQGFTPLHKAMQYDERVNVARLLLEHGADIYAQDNNGQTPLHVAARNGLVNVARLLFEHGADISAHDNDGQTPLHVVAAQYERVNVAWLLFEHGADVNAQDNNCNTPLLGAVKRGCLEVARLLVEHGANLDAEDNEGRTPFQVASEGGYHDIAMLLSVHGSK
jgi:ankyrin repeat protein